MSTLDIETVSTATKAETEQEQKSGTMDEKLVVDDVQVGATTSSVSRTLALIKPDAMQANHKDEIIKEIKENGFIIVQEQQLLLSQEKARLFYKEHEGKPFYQDLTHWMSSAPIYALILEKQDAVPSWRHLMGPTNSSKAREVEPNSIRALFGTDGSQNATHGSDSQASAEREIALIFGEDSSSSEVVQVDEAADVLNKPDTEVAVVVVGGNNTTVVDHDETTVISQPLHPTTDDLITNVTCLSEQKDAETIEEAKKVEKEVPLFNQVPVNLDATIDATLQGTAAVATAAATADENEVLQSNLVADIAEETHSNTTTIIPPSGNIDQVDEKELISKQPSETGGTGVDLEQQPTKAIMVDKIKTDTDNDDDEDKEPKAGAAATTPELEQEESAEAKDLLDKTEPAAVAVTAVDSDNVDEQKMPDEPVHAASVMMNETNQVVAADATVVAVTAHENGNIPDSVDDAKTPRAVTVNDIATKEEDDETKLVQDDETKLVQDDVKLKESVTQEKEQDDPKSTTTSSSNNSSIISHSSGTQSSKHSSVTEKNQVKEKIKETHVNKLKTPGSGAASADLRKSGRTRPAGSTVATTDKKKVTTTTNTGLTKPNTGSSKKLKTAEQETQTKTKVPSRVALLSQPKKKPVRHDSDDAGAVAATATVTATDKKTKKAIVGAKPLVSKLTASTAASARKKTSSADGITTSTSKPADGARPKKISTSSIKKTPSSIASTTVTPASKAPPTTTTTSTTTASTTTKPSIPISAGAKKTTTTERGSTRRTPPPTSTLATKKVDGTAKRTTTGTRAAASGLPSAATTIGKSSTRKETLSTGSKLKNKTAPTTTTTKAAAVINKKSATAVSQVTKADTTLSGSSIASCADHTSSSSSSDTPAVSDELGSTKENGPEQQAQDNDSSDDLMQKTDIIVVVSLDNEQENKETETMNSLIQESMADNEQQVESVEIAIQQHDEEPSPSAAAAVNTESDDAIPTTTIATATVTATTLVGTKKPQMASLRSRFENLNGNTNTNLPVHHHQLHTSASKEIPNRISNMINAFNK